MSSETYEIEITGEGVSIKQTVPKEIGDQIVVLILTGKATHQVAPPAKTGVMQTGQSPAGSGSDTGHDLSIREAIDASGAKRAPDKITVIGDYIKTLHKRDFTRDDIVQMFESAAEKVPANLARDIKWTLKAGWIAQRSGSKTDYYVTNTGNQALQAQFSPEVVKRTRQTPGSKRRSNNPKSE